MDVDDVDEKAMEAVQFERGFGFGKVLAYGSEAIKLTSAITNPEARRLVICALEIASALR